MSAKDRPFMECVRKGVEMIQLGHDIYQKFSCAQCGARNTMEVPNMFFKRGTCSDCGHLTDIEAQGCGYILLMKLGADAPGH